MNETRTAFDRLREDVERSIDPQGSLGAVGRRRGWAMALRWGSAVVAGAAAIVVAALVVPSGTPEEPVGADAPPMTTVVSTTAPSSTSTEVPRPGPMPVGALLIAAGGEIVILDGIEVIVQMPAAADTVVGGGDAFVWEADGVVLARSSQLAPQRIATGAEGSTYQLMDLAEIEDAPTVITLEPYGGEELQRATIRLYDLLAGEERQLVDLATGEGAITRVSFGGGMFVTTTLSEGESWFTFYDTDGSEIEVANNPKPFDASGAPFVDQGVLSPDGTRLAYLETSDMGFSYDGSETTWLVVYDMEQGVETRRIELPSGEHRYTRLDYDGEGAVLSRDAIDGDAYVPLEVLSIPEIDTGEVVGTGIAGVGSLPKPVFRGGE